MTVCGVFVVAVAFRLARFNVSEPPGGKHFFFGIPTTLMGAFLSCGFLASQKLLGTSSLFFSAPLIGEEFFAIITFCDLCRCVCNDQFSAYPQTQNTQKSPTQYLPSSKCSLCIYRWSISLVPRSSFCTMFLLHHCRNNLGCKFLQKCFGVRRRFGNSFG